MVNNLYKITYNIENKKVITTIEVEINTANSDDGIMGNVQSYSSRENRGPTLFPFFGVRPTKRSFVNTWWSLVKVHKEALKISGFF